MRAGTLRTGLCSQSWGKRGLGGSQRWQGTREALGTFQVPPAPCSLPARPAEPPFSQQAMSPTLAFILALLATHTGLKVQVQVDEDAARRMQEREEYLHQEMTRLLQEIEGSSGTMETLLPSALQQQWLFWVNVATLVVVLLAVGCWLVRRKRGSASCSEQERSNSEEKVGSQEKVSEQDEKVKGADSGGSTLAVPTPSPVGTSGIRLERAVSNLV